MIVNSSQGGGSKDTWVLDDGDAVDLAPGTLPRSGRRGFPTCATAAGTARPSSNNSSSTGAAGRRRRLMLARIAQELFWLGRDLTRGEHTARTLDGAFHADVAGAPGQRGISLTWDAVLTIIGGKPPMPGEEALEVGRRRAPAAGRTETARLLTLDVESQASIVSCIARARERGGILRDVISTEMWEALNSFYLSLGSLRPRCDAANRPVLALPGGQGALRAVLGPRRPDDAARRRPGLPRGGWPDRAGRHGLAHALGHGSRRARRRRSRERGDRPPAFGRRRPGLPPRRARCADRRSGRPLPPLRQLLPGVGRLVGRGAPRRPDRG